MRFELLPPVPAVALARQLRQIPLFGFASVDELFRISSIAQQVRYEAGATVQERGSPAEYIQVLVQGELRVSEGGEERPLTPPALLGFQEVLEGSALRHDAAAAMESIALVMPAEDFRTLLSANIEMAQGLFGMLLGTGNGAGGSVAKIREEHQGRQLGTVDKVMVLQALPILTRATAEEIYALAAIAREEELARGDVAFSEGDAPSILLLLSGELELTSSELPAAAAGPGTCLGFGETLAGQKWRQTGHAVAAAKTLRIEREALLELLSDRIDLLQGIFSAIFRGEAAEELRS